MRRRVSVEGPDPVDVVWERYADPDAWTSWAPPIRRVDASSSRLVTGMTGVVHGPPGLRVAFEVESVDETAHAWTWRVHLGVLEVVMEHAVERTAAGGSRASLVVDGPAVVALTYPPIARIALLRLVGR